MNTKFLGIIIMALQLGTSAYGVNPKLLEFEADTHLHRVWSNVPSNEEMVKGSLSFVSREEVIEPEYVQSESFHRLYEKVIGEISDERFVGFSQVCKTIFETSDDQKKAAVYMLLEKVWEKSTPYLKMIKKMEDFKRKQDSDLNVGDADGSLKFFMNFDRVGTY